MAQVGCRLQEDLALVKSFADQLVLLIVKFKERLLKISYSTVDELG